MITRCLGMALLLLVSLSLAFVEAAPKPKAPPAAPTLDADKLKPGVFTGTVVSPPDSDRMFTVNVTYQKIQLKPGQNLNRTNQQLQRQYHHITQLQNQLMHPSRRHNPASTMQQLQNALVQFQVQQARAEANMFQVVNASQKVIFQAEENVKVRVKAPPEQFDDKGNIKKYTREELTELKGKNKNLPGYESAIENLRTGQLVQVTLGVHRKSKPALPVVPATSASADKDKDADKDADKDRDSGTQHKLQARMIVIVKDADASQAPKRQPQTNNKKKKQ